MKYAFITGAVGGLGTVCVESIVSTGEWIVFAADINDIALAKIAKIENVIPIKVDITNQDSIEMAYNKVREETDKIHALINLAGFNSITSLVEGNAINICEKSLQINVMSMVRVNRIFFDMVKNAKGRIINCSSECGIFKAQPFNGPYSLSKHAVEVYSDSLRKELMFQDVKVVKLQPGSFRTQMHGQAIASFDILYESTQYYKDILKKSKPIMEFELKRASNTRHFVKAFMHAVTSDKPKRAYKIKTGKAFGFTNYIPDVLLEFMYRNFLKN